MLIKFLKFFFIIFMIFSVHFIIYGKNLKQYFPESNIVWIQKLEKFSWKKILFEDKRPEKISSKWIFIEKNKILTVAHWVWSKNDEYLFFSQDLQTPFKAKLIFKNIEKDFAILESEENFYNFSTIKFAENIPEKEIYFYKNWKYLPIKISEKNNEKIFIKKEFLPWDSGTIFFNEKKEIVWILSEYDLNKKNWIINILEKNF